MQGGHQICEIILTELQEEYTTKEMLDGEPLEQMLHSMKSH